MPKKRKADKPLVIKGRDVMHKPAGFMRPSFRGGAHMTEKDRPRDRNWRKWL